MQTQSFLLIDGSSNVTSLKSVTGGNFYGDVVTNDSNDSGSFRKKHISNVSFTPVTIKTTFPFNTIILNIINSCLENRLFSFSGKILINYDNQASKTIQFFNAIVTDVVFPGGDHKITEVNDFIFTIMPEQVKLIDDKVFPIPQPVNHNNDQWISSNFTFEVDGLEDLKIIKVDTFTLTRKVITNQIGISRDQKKDTIPAFDTPNLRLTISDDKDGLLNKWAKSWFFDGFHSDADERKSGIFTCLSSAHIKLLEVQFKQIGLVTYSNNNEGILLELYYEEMKFLGIS